jgi:hypothetical protein
MKRMIFLGTMRTVNVNVMLSPRDAYQGGTLQVF